VRGPDPSDLTAFLIDLDGTLIDTVERWRRAYVTLADELGVAAPPDLWPRVAGRSMRASLDVYGDAVARHDPDALIDRLVVLAAVRPDDVATARTGWRWLPGARELLTTLRPPRGPRPRVALVTSAWRAFTVPMLATALGGEDHVAAT